MYKTFAIVTCLALAACFEWDVTVIGGNDGGGDGNEGGADAGESTMVVADAPAQ